MEKDVAAGTTSEPKMVIVIRKDLKLRRGKEIVQGCHFIADFVRTRYFGMTNESRPLFRLSELDENWLFGIQKKICLCVNSLEELMDLLVKARANNLESHLIQDLGLTEVEPDTYTALVIGPDLPNRIDKITSHLKLY